MCAKVPSFRRRLRAEERAEEQQIELIKAQKAKRVAASRRKLADPTTDTLWAAELASWVNSNAEYQMGVGFEQRER